MLSAYKTAIGELKEMGFEQSDGVIDNSVYDHFVLKKGNPKIVLYVYNASRGKKAINFSAITSTDPQYSFRSDRPVSPREIPKLAEFYLFALREKGLI
ncbi:MAG: hypothetical protein V1870_01855 [Candidatus Aenigmatarchaeota archaeon]